MNSEPKKPFEEIRLGAVKATIGCRHRFWHHAAARQRFQ